MDNTETARKLKASALDEFARTLYDGDINGFESTVAELARSDDRRDYEIAARMIAILPMAVKNTNGTYSDARYGALAEDGYFSFFLKCCADCGLTEDEIMPMLFYAQYAPTGSALCDWDKCFDRWLAALADNDFDRAASYIDRFDRRYRKYSVLMEADRARTINKLVEMALFSKGVDKTAVRDFLMDYDAVADALMAIYGKSAAHERVAIVRLLLAYKNDLRVKRFFAEIVSNDTSKSVRKAALGGKKSVLKPACGAAHHLEALMAAGKPLSFGEWQTLFEDENYVNVAEKIFFYRRVENDMQILLYNDGAFIDETDSPVELDEDVPVYVLHTLDIAGKFDIAQPFPQINRPTFMRSGDEKYYSSRFLGTMTAGAEFRSALKKLGFVMCDKREPSDPNIAVYVLGEYAVGVECDMPKTCDTVGCGKIFYYSSADIVKLRRRIYISSARPLDIAALPPRAFSELTYSVCKLFGCI